MKTKNWGKIILSLLLAVMMILPSVAAMADEAADEDPTYEKIWVEDGVVSGYDYETDHWSQDAALTESRKLDGDLELTVEEEVYYSDTPVLSVNACGTEESFEVTGSVTANITTENYPSYADANIRAAKAYAYNEGSAELKVDGDITVSVESSGDWTYSTGYGVYSYAEEGSKADVSVDGDVNVSTIVMDESEDGTSSEESTSVGVGAYGEGETDISIGGSVEVFAEAPEGYATAGGILVNYNNRGGDGFVGNAAGGEEGEESASSIIITVAKDVSATASLGQNDQREENWNVAEAGAVVAQAYEGQTVDVTVEGHVFAEAINNGDGMASATGVGAIANGEGAEVNVTVNNGIEVNAEATEEDGANAVAINTQNNDGVITVNVDGDVVSSQVGIGMEDTDGTVPDWSQSYEGEITPGEDDKFDPYWDMYCQVIDGETVFYSIDEESGKVLSSYCSKNERKGGESFVTVMGNVTADDTAVAIDLTEAESTMEVTVTETVEGKEHAIVLSQETIADNLTLTVWEVKANEDGNIVERAEWVEPDEEEGGEGSIQYTADKDTEKLIQYIIKIEDNSKDYIATTGTTDFTASNGEKYNVAHEGDKVLVKLNIPEGKELVGAYWDVAKSEKGRLLVDADGNYYLEVPRGGGVQLSLVMKDAPKVDPEPEPEPESNPIPVFTLAFYEDAQAEAKNVTLAKGRVYTLPTPTVEGKTFVGWAESDIAPTDPNWKAPAEGDASILPAGTQYVVTSNKYFIGIWK